MAKWGAKLFEPRKGICLHYDASQNDKGAVAWFRDPRCEVSYQFLVTDDGEAHRIAPDDARAYHAGVCKPSAYAPKYEDANSAFYGVAIAATDGDVATLEQIRTVTRLCVQYFLKHGWGSQDVSRIVSHKSEAWPRGRKHDPEGTGVVPVMRTEQIREEVQKTLQGTA